MILIPSLALGANILSKAKKTSPKTFSALSVTLKSSVVIAVGKSQEWCGARECATTATKLGLVRVSVMNGVIATNRLSEQSVMRTDVP